MRVDHADDQEPRLALAIEGVGVGAQPAIALGHGVVVGVIALVRRPRLVAVGGERVKAVLDQRLLVVDRVLGIDDVAPQLELAEIGGLVAQLLHGLAHARAILGQAGHVAQLHLVEHAVDLGRLAAEDDAARGRAHGRGDVMAVERGAPPPQLRPAANS